MGLLRSAKYLLFPLRREDPDFGTLRFMYIPGNPNRSYWEAEWMFPATGTPISICLDGDETGPRDEFRQWYLGTPSRFEEILQMTRPILTKVLSDWLEDRLPNDPHTVVKVTGFNVSDPLSDPVAWEISFETVGERWLAVTVPFIGSIAEEAIVDT